MMALSLAPMPTVGCIQAAAMQRSTFRQDRGEMNTQLEFLLLMMHPGCPYLTSMNIRARRSGSRPSALPVRLPAARRHIVRPAAALDAATVEQAAFLSQQLYSFCSTLTGFAAVTSVAYGLSHLLKQRSQLAAAVAPAAAPAAASAAAHKTIAVEAPAAAEESAVAYATTIAVASPLSDMADIRAELQQAADAAVAAIASEAAAEPAPRPAAPLAAAQPAAPTKAGSEQRLTAEDATRQVQEWIAAWGGDSEEQAAQDVPSPAAPAPVAASASAPIVTDVTPATAAAVLDAMTANAPVGITAIEAPAAAEAPAAEEAVPVLAAAGAAPAPTADEEDAVAEADRAYRERIAAALADSPALSPAKAKASEAVEALQTKVGAGHGGTRVRLWS